MEKNIFFHHFLPKLDNFQHFMLLFPFQDPVITDFFPKLGPKAGGTAIKIKGQHLNIGRNRKAFIGDVPCILER